MGRNGYGGVAPCRRTSIPLRFVPGGRCVDDQRNPDIVPNPAGQLCALPTAATTRNTCTGDQPHRMSGVLRVYFTPPRLSDPLRWMHSLVASNQV